MSAPSDARPPLVVTNLRHELVDGTPTLRFEVNGRTAGLIPDNQKRWTYEAGYVFLGTKFEDLCPVFSVPEPWNPSCVHEFRGWTDDPVVRAIHDLFDVEDLPLGPLPIPDPKP